MTDGRLNSYLWYNGGEDLYGGDSSSAYIKQLSTANKADSAVGQGVLPTGHDYCVARDIIIGPHGRLDQ